MTEPRIIQQRERNRVIEMLEWLIECEHTPPDLGMNELINSWSDYVPSSVEPKYVLAEVFTDAEQKSILRVNTAVDAFCDATPQSITDEHAALRLPEWTTVVVLSRSALSLLMERGKMPEEELYVELKEQ